MPTYKNETSNRIVADGRTVEPGQTYSSIVYVSSGLGLTKKSDAPMYNPVILEEKVTSNTEIDIPESDPIFGGLLRKFSIHFYVESGEATIYFNSISNTPALELYQGAKWNIKCFERVYNKLIVNVSGTSPKVWVIIER